MKRTIRFFVCSRNRAREIKNCILSLSNTFSSAFPKSKGQCYIFDDSTQNNISTCIRKYFMQVNNLGLNVKLIGFKEQQKIVEQLSSIPQKYLSFYERSMKNLGRGPWDLAGVRNFAYLYAHLCSKEDDLLIFLDDDILFSNSSYYGHLIKADGVKVLKELYNNTDARKIVSTGVDYLGKTDTSIDEHLSLVIEKIQPVLEKMLKKNTYNPSLEKVLKNIVLVPMPMKITMSYDKQLLAGPGISGGVMATTPASLKSHHLPRCYNEDWIWLSLLGNPQNCLRKTKQKLIHAEPPDIEITPDFLTYQMIGEINYYALESIINETPDGHDRIVWCKSKIAENYFEQSRKDKINEINTLTKQAAGLKKQIRQIKLCSNEKTKALTLIKESLGKAIRVLESTMKNIENKSIAFFYNRTRNYLEDIPTWRTFLDQAKQVVDNNVI